MATQSPAKKTKKRKDFDIFQFLSLVSDSTVWLIVDACSRPRKPPRPLALEYYRLAGLNEVRVSPSSLLEASGATKDCYRETHLAQG